ncbi:hypothetical protein T265_08289 [Opisthorchis viverrini]|uniref:Reverse transcriptase domain-containing protein n=1 Tax=Opisthorchis viverrini TaxID=6198 RepID=A0A074Z9X6_OPIVI|nr:hypothetical protein T265_08289 [Opisthorchis viverrini]KER23923.1 hypothetical protein T265_08289 [Opisthorchis viverrini]
MTQTRLAINSNNKCAPQDGHLVSANRNSDCGSCGDQQAREAFTLPSLSELYWVGRCTPTPAAGKLSPEFTTSSGGRQGCPLSHFLFNLAIDTIMEASQPASNTKGVEVLPGPPLTDIEGGQPLTWQRSMKEITKRLGSVGATRLPGWGPRDLHCAWLETLQDMAANRYSELSPKFVTPSGIRQGCPLSPFLFNFVTDTIMEDSPSASNACGIKVLLGRVFTEIEYEKDKALLGSDPVVIQTVLINLITI